MEEYEDDFEDRFADELENLAEFESQESLPVQPPAKKKLPYPSSTLQPAASQSAKNAAADFFGGSQSALSYPDDELEAEVTPQSSRKRPTSGDAAKSVEKRRRVEIDDDDDDDDDRLVIDDPSSARDDQRRVLDAINGDVPKGGRNGFHVEHPDQRPSVSLSTVLKNKGRPLPNRSDDDDRADHGFEAGSFRISRESSSRSAKEHGVGHRRGLPVDGDAEEEDHVRAMAKKVQDNVERRRIRKHPPTMDEYVYVTERDKGKRVYLAVKPEDEDSPKLGFAEAEGESRDDGVASARKRGRQLLGVDYDALKRRVMMEMEARESAVRADEMEEEETLPELEMDEGTEDEVDKHHLWVEKYGPRGYTDLLSDDGLNRTLLKWLKLWDKQVFDKEVKLTKDKRFLAPVGEQKSASDGNYVTKFGKKDGGGGGSGSFGKGKENVGDSAKKESTYPKFNKFDKSYNSKFKDPAELIEEFDKLGRPEQKIVLISGPPGLGKTTLAHIVAKHVGYAVQEMNASDDRSPEAFKNKIEAACQTQSVMGADPRPNCLIIDEIDGATAPAINVLLNFLKVGMGGGGGDVGSAEGGVVNKKKTKLKPLLRPVICICNDLYAPSLRPLRPLALILKIPPTDPSRLVSRLLQITRQERLKADQSTLMTLCLKMDNDIRGCLNTLQFIRGRYKELTMGLVKSTAVGTKDVHRSLYSVWQSIFQMPRAEKKGFSLDGLPSMSDGGSRSSLQKSRFSSALHLVESAGETEKVLQGLFDNYLLAKIKDARMVALNIAESWLVTHDQINSKIQRTQNYVMMPYLYFTPVTFHMIFAMNHPPKIKYPNSEFDNYTKSTQNDQLLRHAMNDIHLKVRKWLTVPLLLTDVIPPLLEIIQPQLRPVNVQLYSAKEKAQIKGLIDNMLSFSLTYQQEKTEDGQYRYALEPKIDKLARYRYDGNNANASQNPAADAVPTPSRPAPRQLTYAAKQMISRELELEKMRRSEAALSAKVQASPVKRNPFASPSKVRPESQGKSPTLTRLFGGGEKGDGGKKNLFGGEAKSGDETKGGEKTSSPSAKPQMQIKLSAPTAKSFKPVVLRDFFGRIIKSSTNEDDGGNDGKGKGKEGDEKKKPDLSVDSIWFCFKKGYSNAVRKPIKIRELL